ASNYTISYVNGLLTVTPAPLTVTATGVDKTYDGTTAAVVTLSWNSLPGDNVAANCTSAVFADKNAGTGKPVSVSGITISGPDAGNYALQNTTAGTTANITPAALAVAAKGVNRVYNGTTAATVTLSNNRIPGDTVIDTYTSATLSLRNSRKR